MAMFLTDTKGVAHEVPKAVERSLPDNIAALVLENRELAAAGEPLKPVPDFDKVAHRQAAIDAWAKAEGITLPKPPATPKGE